ncbi:putative MFS family arabinose efflux permease [Streptomyces sp. BK208]|uniref:MFS transporter n=1 Tax=Streptomyces sp. BK208 TaxID=2512150 RepID=UPI00105DF795|nr:MFS transporter [Streptomyces sp. BK208]TDT38829.1 putative MFS family arabinose efflux permease [Streptomyces sp. BK208]
MTDAEGSRPSVRRHRDFLLLWGSQTISETGSQITVLALPLVAVVLLDASAFQVGLLAAAETSAYLLVALPAGVVVDRVAKRRLMIGCDLALFLVIGSVPLAHAFGKLTLAQLFAVAVVSSVFSVFFSVAYQSYLPVLLDRDQLLDGNSRLAASRSVAQIAGPGLGGGLVTLIGAAGAMAADALSFAASAGSLTAIRKREPRPARPGPGRRPALRSQIREGLAYVTRDPVLRNSVAFNGTANFFVIMVESLGPVFLIRTLHVAEGLVGLLLALGAVGGVVGGVTARYLARKVGSARISWIAMTLLSLPGLLIPLAGPGWRVLLFGFGWISWTFASTVAGISLTSYRQSVCPPDMLGRVSATARWINWGTLPLGGLAGGALAAAVGVRGTLWIAVAGGCCAGLWLFFSPLRGLRDIPLGEPGPTPMGATP